MRSGKPKIGFIAGLSTFVDGVPHAEGALRLIEVLEPLSDEIIWVTARGLTTEHKAPSKIVPIEIEWNDVHAKPFFSQAWYHLSQQAKISLKLLSLKKKVDIYIFKAIDFYVLPMLFARLVLRRKVIIKSDGRPSSEAARYVGRGKKFKLVWFKLVEGLAYSLANTIVVDSYHAMSINRMSKYLKKIHINSADAYVTTQFLRKAKELSQRKYDVGYVGRFSRKKGILEFLQSLSLLPSNEYLKVAIIGGQPEDAEIQRLLADVKAQNKAEVIGWIEPEEVPQYLNEIKLLVIPSYGEGMPRAALEAMACGCVVVATPVGSLPEIIQDGKTGFILKDNSPHQIAEDIARVLSHPDLDGISNNARTLIEREYTYEVMLEKWYKLLTMLSSE